MTDPSIPKLPAIRAALAARGLSPRKRFGQNFLTDEAILGSMVRAADTKPGDVVLEIGPGPGTLTAALLRAGARVLAVEVDRDMVELLAALIGDHDRLEVHVGDALAERPAPPAAIRRRLEEMGGERGFSFVANLPYQVAPTLIADLVWELPPRVSVVTVQDEVRERLAAKPGTREYGPLSVMVQLRASVEMMRRLGRHAFWPAPNVESACVRLIPREPDAALVDVPSKLIREVVRGVFHARRKSVRNSLELALAATVPREVVQEALSAAGVDATRRGETLAPHEMVAVARALRRSIAGDSGASVD